VGITFIGVVALYLLGDMTVGRVAVLTLSGGVLSCVPALLLVVYGPGVRYSDGSSRGRESSSDCVLG
jgi:hypothetical protein